MPLDELRADAQSESDNVQELPLAVANELAYALVADCAERISVRYVFLKGMVADHWGIRPRRVSSDVDVLVPQGRLNDLVGALSDRGWKVRAESTAHRLFVKHSVSLVHPFWPGDIDVHDSYPGMAAEPDRAFEYMWARRTSLTLGGIEVQAIDASVSVVVAALHSLRSPDDERSRAELQFLRTYVENARERQALLDDVSEVSRALQAVAPLRRLLVELGAHGLEAGEPAPSSWILRTAGRGRTAAWLYLITSAPWRHRPALAARAIWPSLVDLEADYPQYRSEGLASVRLRLARLRRALSELPRAVSVLRLARRVQGGRYVDGLAASPVGASRPGGAIDRPVPPAPHPVPQAPVARDGSPDRNVATPEKLPEGCERPTPRYQIADHVATVDVGESVFVLLLRPTLWSSPIVIQGAAAEVWRCFESSRTIYSAVETLLGGGEERQLVTRFVVDAVAKFEAVGVLVNTAEGAASS